MARRRAPTRSSIRLVRQLLQRTWHRFLRRPQQLDLLDRSQLLHRYDRNAPRTVVRYEQIISARAADEAGVVEVLEPQTLVKAQVEHRLEQPHQVGIARQRGMYDELG